MEAGAILVCHRQRLAVEPAGQGSQEHQQLNIPRGCMQMPVEVLWTTMNRGQAAASQLHATSVHSLGWRFVQLPQAAPLNL